MSQHPPASTLTGERADLLETLTDAPVLPAVHRQGPPTSRPRQRTTVSELTLGGLIKHVSGVERSWAGLHRRAAARLR